jgi:signal peptidase II
VAADVPRRSLHRTTAVVAGLVLAADALTKQVAARTLDGRGAVHVVGGVHLNLYRNFGGPAGLLPGRTVLVSVLTVVAVVLIAAAGGRVVRSRAGAVALGLMVGGGLGNLADRLLRAPGPFRGGVVDWLALRPGGGSMNLADLSLNLAVVVLFAGLVAESVRERALASSES